MRIAIDATPLLFRSAGVKNYLYHWIAGMQAAGGGHTISRFPFFGRTGDLDHERSQTGRLRTIGGLAFLHSANLAPFPVLDLVAGRWDVFHASHLLRRPPWRIPVTATVYDMTCWLMPEMHFPANVRAVKAFADKVVRRAAGVIAISECSRQDAIRILDLKPDRIRTIHPGVPEAFFRVTADQTRLVREKYGLSLPYALFVGTVEPRKNIAGLLDAWSGLPVATREMFQLIIAGPGGWADPKLMARLRSGAGNVRYLGYVPETDLPALTAAAELVAYPSLYEGFGFPAAQAMAAGVAVITSRNSSLTEVAGDAAVLVDPHSVSEVRNALDRLLCSATLRREIAAEGRKKAAAYSWDACARKSLEFFAEVAGN